jgi:hypothetical protein
MIDSALGLNPEDMSEAAKAKRVLRGLADLDGITFVAKIQIEPSRNPAYKDANKLDHVVLPTAPEWQKVMAGETRAGAAVEQPRPAAPPRSPHPRLGPAAGRLAPARPPGPRAAQPAQPATQTRPRAKPAPARPG